MTNSTTKPKTEQTVTSDKPSQVPKPSERHQTEAKASQEPSHNHVMPIVLSGNTPQTKPPLGYKAYLTIGLVLIFLLISGTVLWSVLAPIQGAVITQGVLIVETKPKEIQHPIGGVAGEILVENGDFVSLDQVLIRLDATQARSTLAVATSTYLEQYALETRLIAERDDHKVFSIAYPDLIQRPYTGWEKLVDVQKATFTSRQQSVIGHLKRIDQQIAQSREQIVGLEAVLHSRESLIAITNDELDKLTSLFDQGIVNNEKIIQLKRNKTELIGEIGNQKAEIARVKSLIAEREIEAIQLNRNFREQILTELQDISPKLRRSEEELILAQKRLDEIEIKSPVEGFVHGLNLNTVGGIVPIGETIMQIIPTEDDLVIEARVMPQDIDAIYIGQTSNVVLSAFAQHDTPELTAEVFNRSADRFFDQATGMPYYIVMARFLPGELKKLKDKKILPGMPADVFIQTKARSAFSYLTKPFIDALSFAFRED